MKTLKIFGFTVIAPTKFIKRLKKEMKNGYDVNLQNFENGDMFYTDDCNYMCTGKYEDLIWFDFAKYYVT